MLNQNQTAYGPLHHFKTGQFAGVGRMFQLEVLQEPSRSRMTGFGSTDRRSLDPPPVLRLVARNENGVALKDSSLDSETLLCHAELWEGGEQKNHVMSDNSSAGGGRECVRNILGTLTVPGKRLKDQFGNLSLLFVFNDLAVRTEGSFCLRFTALDINSNIDSPISPALARVFTRTFRVYPPKSFPGLQTSTPLTKALAKQGVKLILRKSNRADDEDDELEDEGDQDQDHDQDGFASNTPSE